jgi:serine/threonine-protein kinase
MGIVPLDADSCPLEGGTSEGGTSPVGLLPISGREVRWGRGIPEDALASKEEMMLAARLVHAGIVAKEQAEAVLRERDSQKEALVPVSVLDLLVRNGLITRTELMIFRDRPLEELQPFPKYVIEGKVAEGGMAQVYRATYKPLEVEVALKVMKPEVSRQERFLLRFRREAGILLKLDHPAIVRGYDLGEQERIWYCAMEFADGCDLQTLVERHGPLRENDALHVVVQMARAVAYLDGRGIVHRDLKPSNVVVDTQGRCKIIDLGLCLLRGGMKEDTGAGTTVGTVEYLSPEQARGGSDLDVRSDLYALGITIHHLMTGVVPFLGETPEETLLKQVLGVFKTAKLEKAGASAKLIDLVTRLLEKDRDERIPTAQVLIEEMESKWPSLRPGAPAPPQGRAAQGQPDNSLGAPVPAPIVVPAPIPAPVPEARESPRLKLVPKKDREAEAPAKAKKPKGRRS